MLCIALEVGHERPQSYFIDKIFTGLPSLQVFLRKYREEGASSPQPFVCKSCSLPLPILDYASCVFAVIHKPVGDPTLAEIPSCFL